MKKLLKFIFGILAFVIFFVIIAVIIISVLLYDNSHDLEKENITITDVISEMNYNALETANDDKLSYTFDDLSLNSFLGVLSDYINLDPLEISNIYTTFDNLDDEDDENDTITLYIPLKIFVYKSCLIAEMNVQQNEDSFTLVISNAKIGKVNSDFFLIEKTLDKAFNPETVEKEIKKQGYNIECDYKEGNFYLTIEKNEIFDILIKNINNDLYKSFLNVVMENPDLYDLEFKGKEKGFVINLNTLSSTIPASKSFELRSNPLENAISKAEKLLNDEIIEKNQVSYAVDYLIRGYQNIEEDIQKEIDKINFSSIGIPYVKLYDGIVIRDDTNIVDIISASTATLSLYSPSVNVNLSDDNVNAIIDDSSIIGKTFSFQKNNEINYITIGNIYISSSYHQIILSTLIDLNGKEIKIDATLDASAINNDYKINTILNNVNIGSVEFSDDEQKALLSFLKDNINIDLLEINPDSKNIIINFDEYFHDSSLVALNALDEHISKEIEVLDGYINVKLTPSL